MSSILTYCHFANDVSMSFWLIRLLLKLLLRPGIRRLFLYYYRYRRATKCETRHVSGIPEAPEGYKIRTHGPVACHRSTGLPRTVRLLPCFVYFTLYILYKDHLGLWVSSWRTVFIFLHVQINGRPGGPVTASLSGWSRLPRLIDWGGILRRVSHTEDWIYLLASPLW